MFLRILVAVVALFLVSCGSVRLPAPVLSPYRMEIQQGNFISQEMRSQLKLGMSKDQVRFVMGTPLITDSFHADRWDYVFRRQKPNSSELEQHKLAVFFEGGKLVRMESDLILEASAEGAAVKTPVAKEEGSAPKLEAPAATLEAVAPRLEAPALRSEGVALLRPEAPAAIPEAQTQPTSGAMPESKPAVQAAGEMPSPAPATATLKPTARPDRPADQPQQGKGWWDRLKDAVKF